MVVSLKVTSVLQLECDTEIKLGKTVEVVPTQNKVGAVIVLLLASFGNVGVKK